jgi:hypothetical protein
MTIMVRLGFEEWTSSVDESVWPRWNCASMVIKSFSLCSDKNDAECISSCNQWAREQITKTNKSDNEQSLSFWNALASRHVAEAWIQLVTNEVD